MQNWLSRGLLTSGKIEGGGVQGKFRLLDFFNVMQIAIAKELIDIGVPAGTALRKAQDFAHVGNGPINGLPERLPGLPFHTSHGLTVLAVSADRTWEDLWVKGRDTYTSIRHNLNAETFVAINATRVFQRVCDGLVTFTGNPDLSPGKVLDAEYKSPAA